MNWFILGLFMQFALEWDYCRRISILGRKDWIDPDQNLLTVTGKLTWKSVKVWFLTLMINVDWIRVEERRWFSWFTGFIQDLVEEKDNGIQWMLSFIYKHDNKEHKTFTLHTYKYQCLMNLDSWRIEPMTRELKKKRKEKEISLLYSSSALPLFLVSTILPLRILTVYPENP